MRSGKHTGRLLPHAPGPHGGLVLSLEWGTPYAGLVTEEFVLVPRGTAAAERAKAAAEPGSEVKPAKHTVTAEPEEKELHIYSVLNIEGEEERLRLVYHRSK